MDQTQLSSLGNWAHATDAKRLGSQVTPKFWKLVLVTCSVLCSVINGCMWKVHVQCCHWHATSAVFTVKVAAWPIVQSKWRWTVRAPIDHSWYSKWSTKNEV